MINKINLNRTTIATSIIIIIAIALIFTFWGYQVGWQKGLATKQSITNKYQQPTGKPDTKLDPDKQETINPLTAPPIETIIIDPEQAELERLINQEAGLNNPEPPKSNNDELLTGSQIRQLFIDNGVPAEDLADLTNKQLQELYYQPGE